MKKILQLVILVAFSISSTLAQEHHYWFQNYGAHSSALGGAVVANWFDNSAIFYNPGANAFVTDSSISLSSSTYLYSETYLREGAGPNSSLFSSSVETIPSIFSGVLTNLDKSDITLSYGLLNINSSRYNINKQERGMVDVIPNRSESQFYLGDYSYKSKYLEDWAGLGLSKQMNANFGIGGTVFITSYVHDYYERNEARIFSDQSANSILAVNTFYDELEFRHIGMLAKIGLA